MEKLAKHFNLKRAMVQGGGGAINGAFLVAGLLDEISHITVPIADGGEGIQTFFDIKGRTPSKGTDLKMISHKMDTR